MDSSLTAEGQNQAMQAATTLKNRQIDLIVSSPLQRAYKTAEIIALEIGYKPSEIVKNKLFTERGIGLYSGRPIKEFAKAISSDRLDEGVEKVEGLVERAAESIKWLTARPEQTIAVVSHSDFIGALRLIHQQLPGTHLYKLEELPNGGIYEFDIE